MPRDLPRDLPRGDRRVLDGAGRHGAQHRRRDPVPLAQLTTTSGVAAGEGNTTDVTDVAGALRLCQQRGSLPARTFSWAATPLREDSC
ncbi:hypothetical protein [Kineococcus sp. R86509]|uniref:hypothetical protein n=1 Tax=Kineococcus sp. R86509 TaxID=3093851 RepID=UPI0036D2A918